MKHYFWICGFLGLSFLAACNLLPSNSQPTLEVIEPTQVGTPSIYPDIETPVITDSIPDYTQTPTKIPPTVSATPVPPTPTKETPPQTPTIAPTKQLLLKPTATPHLLGVQIGSPAFLSNFAHPDLGCQWMGVAGQVFNDEGAPMPDLVVEVGGSIAGQPALGLAITGSSESYGPGSYEIKLGDAPLASSGTVWAQVYDLDGIPLSALIYFSTSDDCTKNLVLLNFVQAYTLPDEWIYLPLIMR
jgi:hypothetical protein